MDAYNVSQIISDLEDAFTTEQSTSELPPDNDWEEEFSQEEMEQNEPVEEPMMFSGSSSLSEDYHEGHESTTETETEPETEETQRDNKRYTPKDLIILTFISVIHETLGKM